MEPSQQLSTAPAPGDRPGLAEESLIRHQAMPAMSIELAVERYNTITEFVSRVLRRDVDYGMIPGTDKLTLLKPGAEKLTTFFGLTIQFTIIERIEDWTGEDHNSEPFFYYLYRCHLSRGDMLVAEGDGSCNSRETKYRYREAQRICPECSQAAIIKGKEEYGGGYICFRKKGGCGAKFGKGDPVIESQQVGRVPNAEIADQVNTIQKMSQKRSLIQATLLAVNASDFFTQDAEDVAHDEPAAQRVGNAPATSLPRHVKEACTALSKTEEQLNDWLRKKYQVENFQALNARQQQEVMRYLNSQVDKAVAARSVA